MKRCPKCDKSYSDDTLNFCLDDGSSLSLGPGSEPTLISQTPTVAFTPRPTVAAHASAPKRSPFRWILFVAIIVLAVLLGGGAVAVLYNLNRSPSRAEDGSVNKSSPAPETPTPRALADRSPTPAPSAQPSQTNVPNLTGEWRLVNTIEQTSYPSYTNLRLSYRLTISQTGTAFTAEGEKISEDDRSLEAVERTPIHLTGWVNENSAGATYVEEGSRRKTSGRFAWTIGGGGNKLSGTFVSTAADSSGPSVATREK